MGNLMRVSVALTIFLGLHFNACAQSAAARPQFNFESAPWNALVQGLSLNQRTIESKVQILGGSTASVDCTTASCGPYPIIIIETFDSSGTPFGCLIYAPDIHFKGKFPNRTVLITLPLPLVPVSTATYEFASSPVLLIRKNGTTATPGSSTTPYKDMTVTVPHVFGDHSKDLLYFLLVVQNRQVSGKGFLCGVGDPRIVND